MSNFDFNYTVSSLDLKDALRLCEASNYTYKDENEVKNFVTNKWGMDKGKFKFFEQKETQAFMTGNDKALVLAFRGTEQNKLRDWLTDLTSFFVDHAWGKIHMGFCDALDWVWDDIEKHINKFRDNEQSIWVTGHSLGGALATLAVARCIENNIGKLQGLYTFGQPRVGDKSFADRFDAIFKSRSYRFVNNEDIVPCVPWLTGYEHIGNLCYFDNFGNLTQDPSILKREMDLAISKGIRLADPSGIADKIFPNELDDHKLDVYESYVNKNLNK